MAQQRTTARSRLLGALALVVLIAPLVALDAGGGQASAASSIAPRGIVVVGDSITARYNDKPGDVMQGWWSIVARHYKASVTTYAQSGSGYLRPGNMCTGNRFIDRQRAFTAKAPSLFIIEGGRNDWATCDGGRLVPAGNGTIELAVDTYLATVRKFLPPSTRIIVLGPPWGPADRRNGERVTAIIEAAAARNGLEFVPTTGTLTAGRVVDGVHPNRGGSVALADQVISAIG